jgi:hypothetical protein
MKTQLSDGSRNPSEIKDYQGDGALDHSEQ